MSGCDKLDYCQAVQGWQGGAAAGGTPLWKGGQWGPTGAVRPWRAGRAF
ncbi:hypothetical protein PY32053_01388 [Paracoccus yeei]|uniref:Uncharacterized protein n=1 Tax=Paracoccus yeei TaxID=147645 RepID=A0A386UL43_9RHOB|nr:hypothetical protein PY32053_01388 [Paracoccus yeei]